MATTAVVIIWTRKEGEMRAVKLLFLLFIQSRRLSKSQYFSNMITSYRFKFFAINTIARLTVTDFFFFARENFNLYSCAESDASKCSAEPIKPISCAKSSTLQPLCSIT